jgi:hypothetical protein
MWSVPRCYKKGTKLVVSSVVSFGEFSTGGCEDRNCAREAEESPLLEAVIGNGW